MINLAPEVEVEAAASLVDQPKDRAIARVAAADVIANITVDDDPGPRLIEAAQSNGQTLVMCYRGKGRS